MESLLLGAKAGTLSCKKDTVKGSWQMVWLLQTGGLQLDPKPVNSPTLDAGHFSTAQVARERRAGRRGLPSPAPHGFPSLHCSFQRPRVLWSFPTQYEGNINRTKANNQGFPYASATAMLLTGWIFSATLWDRPIIILVIDNKTEEQKWLMWPEALSQ